MTENKPIAELREHLAKWMIANGFATGHGDTLDDLLKEATWQVKEIRDENSKLRERVGQLEGDFTDLLQHYNHAKKENTRLTAELAALKPKFMGLSPPPCDKCGYNGPGYYQLESHSCVGEKS